jgi:hypothetical protein
MSTSKTANTVVIDGVKYVRADSVGTPVKPGKRAVVVVDRGWIFAGDVTRENGRIRLDRVVWVFRWESIGFDGVIADPKNKKVTLKPMVQPVDLPAGAEIFCVPVADDWGL